jgi:tRNA(fMet)-specific endonuclease VapC
MRYLLDSNAVIAMLRSASSGPAQRARREILSDLATSSVVAQELFYGAFKSQRPAPNLAVFDVLQFTVIEFDRDDARKAGEIRALLAAQGRTIDPYDVLIAGQAVARDLILVTHNVREFSRVPGLQIEDWEA